MRPNTGNKRSHFRERSVQLFREQLLATHSTLRKLVPRKVAYDDPAFGSSFDFKVMLVVYQLEASAVQCRFPR